MYEEYLYEPDDSLNGKLISMIADMSPDENESLWIRESLFGDRRINVSSRPMPINSDPELMALLLKFCQPETPIKINAVLFDTVPFEFLETHLMNKGVGGIETFDVLLNSKDITKVHLLKPYLYEADPFLLRLLEVMDPSDDSLSELKSVIEGVCLACRLCTKEEHIHSIISHISRYQNHSSNLQHLFYHLVWMEINTRLACRLYEMMPAGEDTKRTVVLAAAHSGFDFALYEAIRGTNLVSSVTNTIQLNSDMIESAHCIYEVVEAAIMLGAEESFLLNLLNHPLMEHDADHIYTAAFRGYSEQVLLAIMDTQRRGWYRSAHCLFHIVPFGVDRLPLNITVDIPPSVLKRLFECSMKSEFYFTTGAEFYSDDCYAPFLEWLLETPNFSHVSVPMVTRDRLQKMPQSLIVIWQHLMKEGLDYRISNVKECYRTVHRRRLKAFFRDILHNIDRVDTSETFLSCLS